MSTAEDVDRSLTEQERVDLLNALTDAQSFNLGMASSTRDGRAAATFRSKAQAQRDLARLLASRVLILGSSEGPY